MAPESPNTPAGVQRREARQDRERIQGKNYLEKDAPAQPSTWDGLTSLEKCGSLFAFQLLHHRSLRREANAPAPTGAFSFP